MQDLKSEHVLLHLISAIQPPSLDGDCAAPSQAGSLLDALHSRAPPGAHHPVRLDWVARVRIAAQVARGLDELHEADLSHGAVRAESFAGTLGIHKAVSVSHLGCVLLQYVSKARQSTTHRELCKAPHHSWLSLRPPLSVACVLCRSGDHVTLEGRMAIASRQVRSALAACPAVLLEQLPKGTPRAKQGCWRALMTGLNNV